MKVFFDVVGCRLNQSEVEALGNQFRSFGHEIIADPTTADLAIINTCAVTIQAASDSRKKLRRAARKGAKRVVATGCWASLYPDMAQKIAGVSDVFDNDSKFNIVPEVLGFSIQELSQQKFIRKPLPGDRARTRAFIRIQTGCNQHCSYCLTRIARGSSRSRTVPEVLQDIEAAIEGGAKEIVLTGVQLGSWGFDFPTQKKLSDLLKRILAMNGLGRLRLSSIEPWDIDQELLTLWEDDRLCRHLHIPLQSGENKILRMMRRPISTERYSHLICQIRRQVVDMAITTDIIVGFPGETEVAFNATKTYIEEIGFAGGHVFTFSPRPGTEAFVFPDRISREIAKDRNAQLRDIFKKSGASYREKQIGIERYVLWESSELLTDGSWRVNGLTDNYIRVSSKADWDSWNEISLVKLISHQPGKKGLQGEIVKTIQ